MNQIMVASRVHCASRIGWIGILFLVTTMIFFVAWDVAKVGGGCRFTTRQKVSPYQAPAEALSQSAPDHVAKLHFPNGIDTVIIDIGLNSEILEPAANEFVVAVEANLDSIRDYHLSDLCADLQRCTLINAAVTKTGGLVELHRTSRRGGGHSLYLPGQGMDRMSSWVPAISLKQILDAIPQEIKIFLKTDTNGNDVGVLQSAGASIKRIQQVQAETIEYPDTRSRGGMPANQGQNMKTHMSEMGFTARVMKESHPAPGKAYIDYVFWKGTGTGQFFPRKARAYRP
ncbi:unnamed protein product [Amoebophrya sp. A25]|nr:unnamed protein product [Amoebophrya sp. A25]|eukprot:GSA25T00023412001.1